MPESGACVADGAGTVGERGGVDNGTPGVATARDSVSAASIDGSAGFVAQDAIATAYGTFTINRNGGWYYRLNDDNAAVQALNAGRTLHDRVTITTTGGTAAEIDITIEGANDAAVITGTTRDTVIEKGGVANGTPGDATASGNLDVTDIDSAATFVARTNAPTEYGTFSIDATGSWTYKLDDDKVIVQSLDAGGRRYDRVTVVTADGTSKVIDITIKGPMTRR